MSSIPDIQTDEVELLACGTAITVAFGKIGETVGTVERVVLAESTVPGAHIRRDAPLHLEQIMKSRILRYIAVMTVCAVPVIPARLAAQNQPGQGKRGQLRHSFSLWVCHPIRLR